MVFPPFCLIFLYFRGKNCRKDARFDQTTNSSSESINSPYLCSRDREPVSSRNALYLKHGQLPGVWLE